MKKIRYILAMLPPFLAAIIQFYFWGFISPLIWFLFYPAVFLSAWIGGLATGLASTCISIFFVFYLFLDPNFHISTSSPKIFITMGTFLIMGILFSILLGRLRYLNGILSRELQQNNISHTQEREFQEKKFKALIDNSVDIINLYDENFNLIYLSPSFERVTGFTHKERIESTGLRFVHSDDQEKSKNLMQETLENPGIPIPFQSRLLHKNGNYIWIEGTLTNLLNDVILNAIVSNFRDITERKKAEQDLVESEAKYRSIMESVADNIVVLDKDMRIIYVNHVNPGLKPEDVHGSPWLDWLEESDKPIALYAIAQTISQNVPVETEFRAIGQYDEMTTFNVKFAKIPGEEENIVLVAKDITERKKTELEIHRLHSELEERVNERTKQLAEANKELEAFSYSVSHDLRSPLRAVTGYTNILLEDYLPNLDSEGQRICNVISSEATRMGQLIDDLLSFSRLNRTEIQYSRIDMKAMAQRVFNELIANQINTVEFILRDLPFATGDTVLIRQVWFNLLSNAIKFTSKQKNPRIEISGEETEKENIYSVADNGAGFDMKYSNKLFGVFQRLHTETEFEGTGVGLAIVKRSIMRNNGRVWAEGQINKGAILYFALPKSTKAS